LETSATLPSAPVSTQPPPDAPPVIVHPIRYIVGAAASTDSRPGLSAHWYSSDPSYGFAAGYPVAVMLDTFGTAGASKFTGNAEPTVSSSDLPPLPCSGVTWITA